MCQSNLHAATLAAFMSLTHVMKVVAFGVLGVSVGVYAPLIAAMVVSGLIGNFVGRPALNRMREEWFRTIFKLLMTLLAIRLIYVAASKSGWI